MSMSMCYERRGVALRARFQRRNNVCAACFLPLSRVFTLRAKLARLILKIAVSVGLHSRCLRPARLMMVSSLWWLVSEVTRYDTATVLRFLFRVDRHAFCFT